MNDSKISVRYARALFESAAEKNQLDKTRNDMAEILSVCQVKEFNTLLTSPVIRESQKLKIFELALSDHIGGLTHSLLRLVIRNGREAFIPGIARNFTELYKRHKGIVSATFTSATPVSEKLRKKVEKMVQETMNNSVEMVVEENEALIGGFVLRVEDQQYDASVARSLKNVKTQLLK
jgi:F-type H+-transporting ATPase subunit delta